MFSRFASHLMILLGRGATMRTVSSGLKVVSVNTASSAAIQALHQLPLDLPAGHLLERSFVIVGRANA